MNDIDCAAGAGWHLASITIAGDIIFLAIASLANFIALIERLACGSGGWRGANWGGLAYVRVIRADTRGLSRREKTDNKFTEWGRRDPPYQDPCQVPCSCSTARSRPSNY